MVAFMDAHREACVVESMCGEMPIAPEAYYQHRARELDLSRLPTRHHRDAALKPDRSGV